MQIHSKEAGIADMLAELELALADIDPEADEPRRCALLVARIELEQGNPPDLGYVYNLLATALDRPLATRH